MHRDEWRGVLIGLALLALIAGGIAWARAAKADRDAPGPIPTPPVGYHYCSDGKTIGFCRTGGHR